MSEMIREEMIFRGRVQGVGFRFKVRYLAKFFGVTGWVRNEYDGSVLAEMQGKEEALDGIVQSIYEERYIRIDELQRKRIPLEEEKKFRIIY